MLLSSIAENYLSVTNPGRPRGIQIQRGKPQISKKKLQITSLSPNVLVGDKTQIPNPNVPKNHNFQ